MCKFTGSTPIRRFNDTSLTFCFIALRRYFVRRYAVWRFGR